MEKEKRREREEREGLTVGSNQRIALLPNKSKDIQLS